MITVLQDSGQWLNEDTGLPDAIIAGGDDLVGNNFRSTSIMAAAPPRGPRQAPDIIKNGDGSAGAPRCRDKDVIRFDLWPMQRRRSRTRA
jgi:hypothetical protein